MFNEQQPYLEFKFPFELWGQTLILELTYLKVLLFVALIICPLIVQRFFLPKSASYKLAHILSLLVLGIGSLLALPSLNLVWVFFCLFGLLLYLKTKRLMLYDFETVVGCVPFTFSLIASVWFFAGANEMYLLGYNKVWSYYAALHGNYLGWLFLSCLVQVSKLFDGKLKNMYLISCMVFLVSFLLIAFGINGIANVKIIGAFAISICSPVLIGFYFYQLRESRGPSFYLSGLSFVSILFTMCLALLNEIGLLPTHTFLGVPVMVSLHGLINGLVAIPSFGLALFVDERLGK